MALKKFLRQFLLFLGLFLLANAVLIGGICIMSNTISFKLPAKKHVLILGDSHTTLGINDKYIPQAINMSSEGEGYLYAFLKLEKFLADNDGIDTVLLSFNFNSLYKKKDEWITGNDAIANRIPHYLPFMGCHELGLFALKPVFYESVLKVPVENKRGVYKLLTGNFKLRDMHLGGFVETKEQKIEQALKIIEEKGINIKFYGYSDYQIEYLNKMIAACQKAGVKLILLNLPIYKDAQKTYNQKDFYAYYKQHLQHIPLWDYHNLPYESKKFRDTDHLNADGAKDFSIFLKGQLDAGH